MAAIARGIEQQSAQMKLPAGYFVSVEGNYAAQQAATKRIAILSLVSLLLVFAILYTRYNSTALALIVIFNIPLALIGSVVALWLAGGTLSLATMIGFITLAGISTRNGILKISRYINLALHEGETFGPALVIRGSLERLTPVLLTALSAGLALMPLLLGASEAGREILHPVAVTIFGGLFHPEDGYINPSDVTMGMAKLAREMGATIHQNTAALGYKQLPDRSWVVSTSQGDIRCEHLVFATGNYARENAKREIREASSEDDRHMAVEVITRNADV
jgi:hypothetical protein